MAFTPCARIMFVLRRRLEQRSMPKSPGTLVLPMVPAFNDLGYRLQSRRILGTQSRDVRVSIHTAPTMTAA